MGNSRWVRSPNESMALREDGRAVTLSGGRWACVTAEETLRLKTPGLHAYLDRAIEEVDESFPPAPWTVDAGIWSTAGWVVRAGGEFASHHARFDWSVAEGWTVSRAVGTEQELATTKVFSSSDRARAWADGRLERAEGGLRGPKPRVGKTAAAKLPDIRVTEEERANAERVLEREGVTYSEFVRACFTWAEAHPGEAWLRRVVAP